MAKRPKLDADEDEGVEAPTPAGDAAAEAAKEGLEQASEPSRQAAEGFAIALRCGSILADATQTVSQEWLSYAQDALRRNVEGMGELARCRSVLDLMDSQNDLLKRQMDEFVQSSMRMSDCLLSAVQDAARRIDEAARRA